MSWTITPSNLLVDDADALAYLTAVETADGQALESGVRLAVNAFVKGCKDDGIWPAIKASCILAGARTLAGCLVPLAGTAPTNFNFVAGDYNRKTGLVGDGSTKYLNSNVGHNTYFSTTNGHVGAYYSALPTIGVGQVAAWAQDGLAYGSFLGVTASRQSSGTTFTPSNTTALGFRGQSRSNASNYTYRANSSNQTASVSAITTLNRSLFIFATNQETSGAVSFSNPRLSFYSIGTSLDLALLDTRVTTLMNAFAAAIP